jgi:predicted enzyme related to lactoylglutathione lyase
MSAKSRFVWHDLNTTDVESAQRFYGALFEWHFEKGDGDYIHIQSGAEMIGGARKQASANEGPPNWLGYIGVDDVAATVAAVTKHGGKVYMPTTTIPKTGTFAVVADPTGAVFAPWKSERVEDEKEPVGRPGTHHFCWDELLSTDVAAATKFYQDVIGWGTETMDMGPAGKYTLLKRTGIKDEMGADKNAGGAFKSPAPASFWVTYVAVGNCDATIEKAKSLGGKVQMEATDIPDVGRFASLVDPQGASFAILQPKL